MDGEEEGEPVYLNVYDMFWTNQYTNPLGFGAYHSGVEVYNHEFAFGGGDMPTTGVFVLPPRSVPMPQLMAFKESVYMGHTKLRWPEAQMLIARIAMEYPANSYHILDRNCNHFASDLAERLCGVKAPAWINRAAWMATFVPCLLPPGLIEPPGPDLQAIGPPQISPSTPGHAHPRTHSQRTCHHHSHASLLENEHGHVHGGDED